MGTRIFFESTFHLTFNIIVDNDNDDNNNNNCGRQVKPTILISTLLLQTHARQLCSLALTRYFHS